MGVGGKVRERISHRKGVHDSGSSTPAKVFTQVQRYDVW